MSYEVEPAAALTLLVALFPGLCTLFRSEMSILLASRYPPLFFICFDARVAVLKFYGLMVLPMFGVPVA